MMDQGKVRTETKDGVGYILLDRPPLNVITTAMALEVVRAIGTHDADPAVKVVCMRGLGDRAFAAGSDVGEHEGSHVADHADAIFAMVEALINPAGKLRIAAIHGYCSGGGCEAAFACDLVVAHENARIALPEIRLGVFSTLAGNLMARLGNPAAVFELAATGDWIGAKTAKDLGLIRQIFSAETFETELSQYLSLYTRHSGQALHVGRTSLVEALARPLGKSLVSLKKDVIEKATTIEDYAEGIDAFLNKRQPVWKT